MGPQGRGGVPLGRVHLLWAVPVALLGALALTVAAGVLACGISGCSGGGFGPVTDYRLIAVALLLVAGVVLAAPVALIAWTGRRAVRWTAAAAVGLAWVLWAAPGVMGL